VTDKSGDSTNSTDLLVEEREQLLNRLSEIDFELNETNSNRSPDNFATVVRSTTTSVLDRHSSCPYNFKVYIYPVPSSIDSVRISEEARANNTLHVCQKCILEQFSLEYIILDFFSKFCGRTNNPDEADFFYLPIVRDAEFRQSMEFKGARNRAVSQTEKALLLLLEKDDSSLWKETFNVTDQYWRKHSGGDHIIVMPAPVTNLRHESSRRGFFHYMLQLRPPIFLNLEYSIDFVREYPVCSTQKNIVMPYPTTDPDLFSGVLLKAANSTPRTSLLYYAGGMHGDCIEVRKAMKMVMSNSTKLNGVVPHVRSTMGDREHGFLAAVFCPIPVGDSPSSKRMYDVLNFGCIPVILSDDLIWAYSDQSGGRLNHSSFSFQIPQSVVHFTSQKTLRRFATDRSGLGVLPSGTLLYDLLAESVAAGGDMSPEGHFVNPLVQILSRVPKTDIQYLQKGVANAAPLYRYYSMNKNLKYIPTSKHATPDGEAIEQLSELLSRRKDYGLGRLKQECHEERVRKNHKYVSRYACDSDKADSLVRRRRLVFRD
jgi:hypothetical protein